jgi:PAS domain S-box-containing protein
MITSLRGKLIAATLLIQVALIGVLTWHSQQLIEQRLLMQFENRLALLSPLLSAALLSPLITRDYALAEGTLNAMQAREDFNYLVLLDSAGHRFAVNRWPEDRTLPPPSPPLTQTGPRPERYDVRIPIVYAGQAYGELAFGVGLDFLHRALHEHLLQALTIALAGMLASAALLILISLWLTRHLKRLTQASEALAKGEPHPPLAIVTHDEIGALAHSFESMASALSRRMDDLRSAEQAATRQTLRYQTLLHTASDGMHVMDPEGRLVEASDSFYRMLGYPVGTPLMIWDWDDHWTKAEILEQLPRRGTDDAIFETRHRRADGTIIDVEIVTHGIEIDGKQYIYASARDITARKAAENQLKAFAAEQQAMLNNGIVGIVRLRARRVVWINAAFAGSIGYAPEELQGRPSRIIYPDDASYAAMESNYALLQRGEIWRGQAQFVRKDGTLRWFDVSGGLLPDGDSLWSMLDITDLKNALHAAEKASSTKSRFLANMSHELRTPLNGVLGMTQLLQTTALTDEQRDYAAQIVLNTQSLMQAINDLLDIAELETGKLQLDRVDFDLATIFDQTLDALAPLARAKDLVFSRYLDPALPRRLEGDPKRIAQILDILAGNAIKFTASGKVAVSLALESFAAGRVRLRGEVRDSGIGIPADKLADLFAPFNQIDATMTRRFGGNGLGLAIAKQLVKAMGGEIGVASSASEGSTFWFSIVTPAAPPAESANGTAGATMASFDTTALLARFGGDRDMARLLVASLLDDMPARMDSLVAALAQNDTATARREAHTIKGLAETGGNAALRQIALDIQLLCENDNLAGVAAHLPQCESLLANAMAEWRAYLAAQEVGAGSTACASSADPFPR